MNNKKEIINVAMSTDENYLEFLVVAVCSILKNLSSQYGLHLYVLQQGLSVAAKEKVNDLRKIREFSADFIDVDLSAFQKLQYKSSTYITKIGAGRFLLPEIMRDDRKCIYLDCDLVVRKDIAELWNLDISDYFFGAVEEPVVRSRNKMLRIPEESSHFNSGVLLLNLEKLRQIKLKQKVSVFLESEHERVYGDQDTLNVLFHDQWYPLSVKWNATVSMFYLRHENQYCKYNKEEINEGLKDPGICHFTEKEKPSSYLCRHPYNKEYIKYRKMTTLKPIKLADVNICSVFIKFLRKLRAFLISIKSETKIRMPTIYIFFRMLKRLISGYYWKRKK